ncbi:Cullin-3 [Thoreauomyces humboldtii]|nr:Cullin-3 [Thoreauomyces humboldtii]
MVLYKHGDKLYAGVRGVITDHLEGVSRDQVVPSFPQTAPGGGMTGTTEFLKVLRNVWEEHTTCITMIRDILMYMDKVYVKSKNVLPVEELGLDLFRDVVTRSRTHPIQSHLIDALLYHIRLERDGEVIDRLTVKNVVAMMLGLTSAIGMPRTGTEPKVYETDFEGRFLETSKAFYRMESQVFLRECDATEYLKKAERRLLEEEQRIANYLTPTTEHKIRHVVEEELLEAHVKVVIEMENSGMVTMMSHDKVEDLGRMYKLLSRVSSGHDEMRRILRDHVEELVRAVNETFGGVGPIASGTSIPGEVTQSDSSSRLSLNGASTNDAAAGAIPQASPLPWVEEILRIKEKFDVLLSRSFDGDRAFESEMNSALERSINRNRKAPEFLSLFIDENLKKGLKGKTEDEVEGLLDKTVTLFRFVEEKDIFERYYKQHLAKRLLFGKSVSEDAEKSMIGKLKIECGYQFTQKWEGMFNDMRTSSELMGDYRTHLSNSVTAPKNIVDLGVNVLTTTFWPMNSIGTGDAAQFPPEAQASIDHFQKYYHSRYSGRKLTWTSHFGSADLKATFDKSRKEINVSTFGMIVLVGVFNKVSDDQGVTYEHISDETSIPDADLKRTLQSLALGKHKILHKSTKGKDILPTDVFKVNTAFTSPLHKIRIQQISATAAAGGGGGGGGGGANAMETDLERTETMEKIEETRKHQLEACIVRIMKARKRMEHNLLVAEVIKQTAARFTPSPPLVKKRIEGLIEREYLERDKTDRKKYNYLA